MAMGFWLGQDGVHCSPHEGQQLCSSGQRCAEASPELLRDGVVLVGGWRGLEAHASARIEPVRFKRVLEVESPRSQDVRIRGRQCDGGGTRRER